MYKREEAVSPVIGVILMVAITVILAAVIAAFVFGMTGNVSKTKTVAFTLEQSSGTVTITNMGGQDVKKLASVKTTVDGVTASPVVAGTDLLVSACSTVGSSSTYTAASGKTVITTGTFTDGTSQVLLQQKLS
jgi:archaeal type IV pilus assembly protein PilA